LANFDLASDGRLLALLPHDAEAEPAESLSASFNFLDELRRRLPPPSTHDSPSPLAAQELPPKDHSVIASLHSPPKRQRYKYNSRSFTRSGRRLHVRKKRPGQVHARTRPNQIAIAAASF